MYGTWLYAYESAGDMMTITHTLSRKRGRRSNHREGVSQRNRVSEREVYKGAAAERGLFCRIPDLNSIVSIQLCTCSHGLTGNKARWLLIDVLRDRYLHSTSHTTFLLRIGSPGQTPSEATALSIISWDSETRKPHSSPPPPGIWNRWGKTQDIPVACRASLAFVSECGCLRPDYTHLLTRCMHRLRLYHPSRVWALGTTCHEFMRGRFLG